MKLGSSFLVFVRLYRSRAGLRGFWDFFVFGGLTLLFVHPGYLSAAAAAVRADWEVMRGWTPQAAHAQISDATPGRSMVVENDPGAQAAKPAAATSHPPDAASPAAAPQPEHAAQTPRRPTMRELEAGFLKLSPEAIRPVLQQSIEMADQHRYADALALLEPLDGNDPNVEFLRGDFMSRQTRSFSEALVLYRHAAALGHPLAMLFAANLLFDGRTGTKDPAAAFDLLSKAYAKGIEEAGINLGKRFYLDGLLGKRDPAKALVIFTDLAARGNPTAVNDLGGMNELGAGVPVDYPKAFGYFSRAASLGDGRAMMSTGRFLLTGRGTQRNVGEGLSWVNKSLDAGFLPASLLLADYYEKPLDGSPPDFLLAAQALKKGAVRNFGPAQARLAQLYESGRGLPKDLSFAYLYYGLAAKHGVKAAQPHEAEVERKMTVQERERAHSLLSAAN